MHWGTLLRSSQVIVQGLPSSGIGTSRHGIENECWMCCDDANPMIKITEFREEWFDECLPRIQWYIACEPCMFFKHDVWILHHKNPDRILNKTFSTWGTTVAARVSAATASFWPQPKQQALILLNNPADCTPIQRKLAELRRLACPPSHPDDPDRGPTTCGTNSWAANKLYFTPAPHQPDHFYLWFFMRSQRRWLAPNLQSQKMQTGRLKGAGLFFPTEHLSL